MFPDISLTELKSCGWRTIIGNSPQKNCLTYSSLFFTEASKHKEGTAIQRALQLLGDLCSMIFANTGNDVYTPLASGTNGRTMLPQDLSEHQVEILYHFLNEVDDPELKARLADSIWLKKKNYKIESANIAIEEYKKTIDYLKIIHESDAIERLCRLVNLTFEVGSRDKQHQVLDYVEAYVLSTAINLADGYHYKLFDILYERKYGDLQKLATKCSDIAQYYKSINNYHLMRSFLGLYYKFMKISGAAPNILKDIKIEEAESYVLQANNESSAMKKTFFLETAIKAFRNIPGSSDKIDELHAQLIIEQKNVPNEMITFMTTEIDITQMVKESESLVSGISFFDALIRLSLIINIPNEDELRNKALYSIQENPISHLFAKRFTNEKGKTTGKIPPLDFHKLSIDDDIVTAEMFRNMSITFNLYVESKILPALDKINSEHEISLEGLNEYLTNNPFIPHGHELLYARGLLAGFKRDFVSSALYLVPQIENSIRNILEYYGHVTTSKISSSGIQREKDLNELLIDNNVIKIFGKDIIFVLRAVMTEGYGGNIRNLLAHGLLNYEQLQSQQSVFCWWLILRLVMTPFLKCIDNV